MGGSQGVVLVGRDEREKFRFYDVAFLIIYARNDFS